MSFEESRHRYTIKAKKIESLQLGSKNTHIVNRCTSRCLLHAGICLPCESVGERKFLRSDNAEFRDSLSNLIDKVNMLSLKMVKMNEIQLQILSHLDEKREKKKKKGGKYKNCFIHFFKRTPKTKAVDRTTYDTISLLSAQFENEDQQALNESASYYENLPFNKRASEEQQSCKKRDSDEQQPLNKRASDEQHQLNNRASDEQLLFRRASSLELQHTGERRYNVLSSSDNDINYGSNDSFHNFTGERRYSVLSSSVNDMSHGSYDSFNNFTNQNLFYQNLNEDLISVLESQSYSFPPIASVVQGMHQPLKRNQNLYGTTVDLTLLY